MINGEIKNKVDSLWDDFAAGGLTNPLEVIEQITYLMFIHDLDSADNVHRQENEMLDLPYESIFDGKKDIGGQIIDGTDLKWSVFHDFPPQKMFDLMNHFVFPFIKNLHDDKNSAYSKYMDDAIFKLPTPEFLAKVVDKLDDIYATMDKVRKNEIQSTGKNERFDKSDVQGDLYEYLLSKLSTAGRNGQFRTPRHIIKMMVELMDPTPDDKIADPACGTSGFLVTAAEYLKNDHEKEKEYEKKRLEAYPNFQRKIQWQSQKSDAIGYDILSFEKDGTPRQIEVKSTTDKSSNKFSFIMTENEKGHAMSLPNYWIYRVFDVNGQPTIYKIKNPLKNNLTQVIPVKYQVNIKVKKSK